MSYVETLHREHKQRLGKIAQAAQTPKIKAKPVVRYEIPNGPLGEPKIDPSKPTPAPIPQTWVERQMAIHQPRKEPWFEIADGPKEFEPPAIEIRAIQRAVCKHFDMTLTDLLSQRRTKDVVTPRHIGIYLCKRLTSRSLPEIGRRFGDRDHTTVLSAVRKITKVMEKDIHIRASIDFLTGQLE